MVSMKNNVCADIRAVRDPLTQPLPLTGERSLRIIFLSPGRGRG
jgi:hypothetical protein